MCHTFLLKYSNHCSGNHVYLSAFLILRPSLSFSPSLSSISYWILEREAIASGSNQNQDNMGRAPCCDKANVKKGPWSPEEDNKLKSYIEQHGIGGNWIALPQKIGNWYSPFPLFSFLFLLETHMIELQWACLYISYMPC